MSPNEKLCVCVGMCVCVCWGVCGESVVSCSVTVHFTVLRQGLPTEPGAAAACQACGPPVPPSAVLGCRRLCGHASLFLLGLDSHECTLVYSPQPPASSLVVKPWAYDQGQFSGGLDHDCCLLGKDVGEWGVRWLYLLCLETGFL